MDNENKKVNSAEKNGKAGPRDEITDGFYDLSNLYSSKTPQRRSTQKREEELRRKDEQRRALELEAIKEDIERRYSLQLEQAQQKSKPQEARKPVNQSGLIKEIDGHETVKDELERIDELINAKRIVELKADEENEKKSETLPEKFDLSDSNVIYAAFYKYGDTLYRLLAKIFSVIFSIIKKPFVSLHRIISRSTETTKRKTAVRIDSTLKEISNFRTEIRHAGKSINKAFKKPSTLPAVFFRQIGKVFSSHKKLVQTAVNTLMPIGALLVFLITLNYWNGVTFALEVIYNDESIGYISDESVYIEAKNLVKDRLSSGAYTSKKGGEESTASPDSSSTANINASYALSLVSIDELSDAQVISDRMIENSVDNLTHACGVYIDGKFVCAVKNESDAKTVFDNILAPHEIDAKAKKYVVGFAETIDYVQGLYPDTSDVMWDASKLSSKLTDEQGEKLIRIRKIITSTSTEDVPYETVRRRDATKYSGYRLVQQKGVNGTKRIITTQIFIDGVLAETEHDSEITKEPVDEIIVVGSKTSYNGVYIGEASSKGFLWPAPSCHYVSSPYGWRSSGWHNGIDLVKSGGGALGTPVIASRSGRVEVVQRSNSGYGNMVLINHGDGYKTRYAHMVKGSITVSVGEYVDAGQTIGRVGSTGNSTGPHLHFEVIRNGETQNPKNYIS